MPLEIPLPPELPLDASCTCGDIEGAALALYQRVAELSRAVEEAKRREKEALDEQAEGFRRLVGVLASARFEFDRLARRLQPELTRLDASSSLRALDLFQRAWDQNLRHHGVEVCDLAGSPMTDELAVYVDVEAHVPDPDITETAVRETLSPLVRLRGKVIAAAKVITSVPVPKGEPVQ